MQMKKRYVAIVVLLLLGLTTYNFASPRQVEKQKTSKDISERVSNDKKENKSYAEALEAVEKAEENPTLETVETARTEIQNADDVTVEQVNQLEQRVEVVEKTIAVAALVKEVESLAEVKETRDDAKAKYPNAEAEVNNLEEGDVKDNLVSHLAKVSRLLNDTEAPVVTGVDENVPTNKNEIVYVKDEFLASVTIDGTEYTEFTSDGDYLKFEKKITKEGTHTVTAIDKLGNATTKKFTIDKTAAKKHAVNANVNGYKNEVKEQYATNGNTVTAYISINEELKYNPTFTFYANGKEIKVVAKEDVVARPSSNKKYPYVYEVKLLIDENLVAENGDLTFTVTDIYDEAGNQTADIKKVSNGKVVKLDRTAPVRKSTDFYVSGLSQVDKTFYTQYGKKVVVNITTDEELKEIPTFTLHNNGNDYAMKDAIYRGLNDKGYHLYQASLVISKDLGMTDGEITFTVSNIKDKAENIIENITTPTNGRKVILDNILKIDKLALVGGAGLWSKDSSAYNQYATTGTTIYVNARFYEELAETPKVTINDKVTLTKATKKQSGNIWIYSYTYKIKENDGLADGVVQAKVTNIKDFAGNTAELTNEDATMKSQKTIIIDRTAPTYRFTKAGSSLVKDEIKPIEKDGVFYFEEPVRVTLSDAINLRLHGVDSYYDDKNTGRTGWLTDVYQSGEHTAVAVDSVGNKTEFKFVVGAVPPIKENDDINLTGDITLVNKPFYNVKENEKTVTINGNGHTVTQIVTDENQFNWTESGSRPTVGNMFSSSNGSKMIVNDLTFAGTTQSIALGHYLDYEKVGLEATYNFHTEMNNVNAIGLNVVSYSAGIAPAVVVYGTANLNNVNIYDTKLSELDTDPMWPVYDLALVNYSTTTLNGGKIGSIYMWKHAKLIVKAGTTVDSINVTLGTPAANIVVEDGAKVNKIITKDGEMEYDEWLAQVNSTTVNSVEEFKSALTKGYKKIIIASTLNIDENQEFSAKSKTYVTTKGTITMFNVKEGKSLTLENLVLDGENKYKVDVTKAAETHNDPYNLFEKYPLEQTRIYENTSLITTAGTLTLGKGTVIRNYAHQPLNGTAKQQYGGPAILVTGGKTTIDGLEFTNNVSQLLTAKNATVTINDINVHDTWADGNKAGLIEINTGATMDVNNGTFKNNMMSMRSYGLFIANAGTINMKGGHYENNNSTRNGSNTAGSLFGVESTGKIYMTGGTVQNNIGYRAGAFATRWATDGSIIELNGGIIKNNTTRDSAFKNAAIFVQSNVKIGKDMIVEDKVVLRGATAVLDNNGKIVGDVELVDNLSTFNNNGSVTGTIIVPQP